MTPFARTCHDRPSRFARGVVVVFVLAVYLFAGVLHGLYDLDVTKHAGGVEISLVDKASGHTDNGVIADHHCHGCFTVSVPAAPSATAISLAAATIAAHRDTEGLGVQRGIDPPRPKFLS